jgi:alpha-1,6-mannosyltransferase
MPARAADIPGRTDDVMHLVDTTVFYSPTSGGVKRYLSAKHAWFEHNTSWRHSILVPGEIDHVEPGGLSTIAGRRVPGTFNYRLPLDPARWCRMLDALEPDLIEVGDAFHPAWCAARVAQARHIPLVAFYHSSFPQLAGRRLGRVTEKALGAYVRWLYERFDRVLVPSATMRSYLGSLGVSHTTLQPLGVDADVFRPERRRADLREHLGLAPHTRLLVFAGRFSREKNVPLLLQAFAKLGSPYHLLLIGGDRSERPSAQVTRIPYRRDSLELAGWLASCDALVHAGTKETFGLVVLEAMSCGLPVVGARAGAVPELIDPGFGELAAPDDADSLAEAIVSLYDRDLEALGRTARSRVLDRYTWSRVLAAQATIYATLVGAQRVPAVAGPVLDLP